MKLNRAEHLIIVTLLGKTENKGNWRINLVCLGRQIGISDTAVFFCLSLRLFEVNEVRLAIEKNG